MNTYRVTLQDYEFPQTVRAIWYTSSIDGSSNNYKFFGSSEDNDGEDIVAEFNNVIAVQKIKNS